MYHTVPYMGTCVCMYMMNSMGGVLETERGNDILDNLYSVYRHGSAINHICNNLANTAKLASNSCQSDLKL